MFRNLETDILKTSNKIRHIFILQEFLAEASFFLGFFISP